jgi:hypothetical protein
VLALPYAIVSALSGVKYYDDQGTLMIALRDIMDGGTLYHDIFALYGPFYYLALTPLFGVLKLPLSYDVARIVSAIFWLACSSMLASFVYKLTESKVGSAFSFIAALIVMSVFTYSPLHPQELGFLLLAALLHLVCAADNNPKPTTLALIGAVVGALLMIKINLGLFALLPLALTALRFTAGNGVVRLGQAVLMLALLAMPAVLMSSLSHLPWVPRYWAFSSLTIFGALMIWTKVEFPKILMLRHWGYVISGLLSVIAVSAAVWLALGSSASELLDAVFLQSAAMARNWNISPLLDDADVIRMAALTALAVIYALGNADARTRGLVRRAILWIKLLVASIVIFLIASSVLFHLQSHILSGMLFQAIGAMSWLILIRPENGKPIYPVGRSLSAMIAAVMVLYAYPVAGTQVALSGVLAAVLAPVLLHDVAQDFRILLGPNLAEIVTTRATARHRAFARGAGFFLMASTLFLLTLNSVSHYRSLEPLAFRGATLARAETRIVDSYRWAVAELDTCDSFYTFPGMPSFYFWTDQNPPTRININNTLGLLNEIKQRKVVADLETHRDLCILKIPNYLKIFDRGQRNRPSPIRQYIDDNFVSVKARYPFELLRRRELIEGSGAGL